MMCSFVIVLLVLSVPGQADTKTPIPEPSSSRDHDIHERINRLEERLNELRERLNELKKQQQLQTVPDKTLSKIRVVPESIRTILRPDKTGWASNMVFTPEVARIGGDLFLLFGTQEDNPGKTGIGYIKLSDPGLRTDHVKKKLVVENGYERVSSPEFWSNNPENTATGTLYASDYYVTRVGQWGRYITRRTIRNEDNRLRVDDPRTVLTGSGERNHWMGRAVSNPSIAVNDGEPTLFFLAKTWPKKSNDRLHTLASFPLDQPDQISNPLPDPRTNKTIWRHRIRGIEPIELEGNKTLILVSYYQPESIRVGLDAVLYENGEPVDRKRLLRNDDLRPHLPHPINSNDQPVIIGSGLELVNLNGQSYLYVPLLFSQNKRQVIYRLNISLPEIVKTTINSP